MTELLQAIVGNPLSTFIGKKIEAATRPDLETDDWALNLEICDIINENDNDAKDAVRAIKKRLVQIEQDRNFTVTNRTLTVLETCVSNCSRRFHVLVMTKDFIQELVKLIGPKNNPPINLQERVLRLIERWADAFRNQPDLSGVVSVYNDLKAKGVTFPPKDPNCPNVPIQTPQRSVPPRQPSPSSIRSNIPQSAPLMVGQISDQPSGPVVLEGEGYNKISRDLGVVQSSVEMFNDILAAVDCNNDNSDWKLATDLNNTCRQMKERIVDLIERVANEDLTVELLRLNDELNNIFIKFDRQVKKRAKAIPSGSRENKFEPPSVRPTSQVTSSAQNDLSLIDFNAGDEVTPENQPSSTSKQEETIDPFDTTAALKQIGSSLSKTSPDQQSLQKGLEELSIGDKTNLTTISKTANKLPDEISSVREQDFAEIENWLSTDSGRNLTSLSGDLPSAEPVSLSNSDFEKFIANRALAGSSQPSTSSTGPSKQPDPEPST